MVEREQIKWLLFAAGLFALVYIPPLVLITSQGGSQLDIISNLLLPLGLLGFPIAITIAILRYQLWDINVIIRKTAVYALLTALLALVYFGVIVVLQSVFEAVSGQQSPITIVVSTLVIAALFGTLRRRVQDFIDRRFFRRKYDAEKTLAAFGQFVRDETDMEALTAELQRVVNETMQPERATIWLKEAKR
jgi:K+-sensing histidine kinase KdpD